MLKNIVAPKYGINTAVQAWGGPDMQSKDFTVNETWYEVKTIGANADSIHISSLTQLASEYTGHLAPKQFHRNSKENALQLSIWSKKFC